MELFRFDYYFREIGDNMFGYLRVRLNIDERDDL